VLEVKKYSVSVPKVTIENTPAPQLTGVRYIRRAPPPIFSMSTNNGIASNASSKPYRLDARHLCLTYANVEQQLCLRSENTYTLETFLSDLRDRLGQLGREYI